MRNFTRAVLFVLLILALLVAVAPLLAQEATPEAPVITSIDTDAGPVVLPGGTDVVLVPSTSTTNGWQLPLVVVGAFIVGALASGVPFAVILRGLRKDQKDMLEQAFESIPPVAQERLHSLIMTADQVAGFVRQISDALTAGVGVVKEVTDGQSNADPPNEMASKS